MSAKFERIVKSLSNTIKAANKKKTSPYDTTATVKRVEGKTAYVHIPGGVDETPVEMTINAAPGDSVQVRVGGGKAWLVGNGSAPPTDDTRANQSYAIATEADEKAIIAGNAAESAQRSAEIAHTAAVNAQNSANEAKASAYNANEYATRSLASLSTVQSVAETLTWITQHGTMTLTTDTEVNPTHVYFVVDATGDYVVGNTHYSLVVEPKDSELSTYYELSIDESLNNYIGTHLAVTGEGLWLLPAGQNSYKVLIATGAGTTYTTAGTYIINDTGGQVASFRADGVTIGELLSGQVRIELSTGGMQIIRNSSGTDIVIANIGYGETAGQSGTSYAPYFTFGERKKPANAYSSTTTYSLGDLVTYNNKEYVYVNANPDSGHAPSAGSAYWKLTVGNYSLAEGFDSVSAGFASHAEGQGIALGNWSHSEGYDSISAGINAHSEGYGTVAQGSGAHSEGVSTFAQGAGSHSEGSLTYAFHDYSHAGGYRTKTSRNNQTVIGEWNADDSDALYIVGNGTGSNNRSNAFAVLASGFITGASNALIYRGEVTGDANNVTTTGIYYIGGTPLTNGENVKWRHLVVINGGVISQLIFNIGANSAILCRIYSGNPASWSPWYSIT